MGSSTLSIHGDKIRWGLGAKLKRAVKVITVAVLAIPIAPVAAAVIATTGVAMAGKGLIDAKEDMDYMDYVYGLDD